MKKRLKGVRMRGYNTLRIKMKDGSIKEFDFREWSDYEINNGFVIVKDSNGSWVAAYNKDCVENVELEF